MLIREVPCSLCGARFIVERDLSDIKGIRLHCPECHAYFEGPGSDGSILPSDVANASVSVEIWQPEEHKFR